MGDAPGYSSAIPCLLALGSVKQSTPLEWDYKLTGVSTPKLALSVYLKDNFERTSTEDTHLHRAEAMRVFLILRGDIPRLFIDNQVKEPTRTTGGVGGI